MTVESIGPRRARLVAIAAAALVLGLTIRFSTFVAWGTDSAAYLTAAHDWAAGNIVAPSELPLGPTWAADGVVVSAFGHRPGVERGTDVVQYPLGYPVLMAAAIRLGGGLAAYLVVPFCAALLVLATYRVGAASGDGWVGALAASLVALSPVTFVNSVVPMSDVPATAFWVLAWASSARRGLGAAAAAGAAVALAVMIRPNLAPLALVVTACLIYGVDRPFDWRQRAQRLVVFLAVAAIGPLCVLSSQHVLYGGYLEPGYPLFDTFYKVEHIRPNLTNYPRFLAAVHTPLVFAGLAAPLWLLVAPRRAGRETRWTVWSAVAFALLTLALYLPFLVYDDIHFLRFMLPAVVAVLLLLALTSVAALRWALRARRWLLPAIVAPVLAVATWQYPLLKYGATLEPTQRRVLLMGRYLEQALPRNAVVIANLQSGAIVHYASRPIVRWDFLERPALAQVVADLTQRGYRPVLVLDEAMEMPAFVTRFGAPAAADWQRVAVARDRGASLICFEARTRGDERSVPDVIAVE